jgi:hypothetical protein
MYWTGFAFLIADCFISLFSIFAFEKIGILYSIALIALSFWYMYERFGTMFRFPFFQTAIINTHLLATMLNLLASTESDPFIGIIILLFINIAHSGYSRFTTQTDKVSDILSEITESILASILLIVIALCKSDYPATTFISSILLFPMLLIRIKTLVDEKNPLLSVWYGIKFTFYTYITTAIFTNINDQQFIVSVLFMVLAGICIAFGFMKELKALRIYGLVMIMSSVFKMVVIDVWNQESIIRVVSLIAGGIICFAISAAYSKFEKRQTVEITEGKSAEDGE